MSIIVIILTTIDLILAVLVLGSNILLIKWHDKLIHKHFLFKKRARALRRFKELYHSYEIYRVDQKDRTDLIIDDERFKQLLRNNFIGEENFPTSGINQEQDRIEFRKKLYVLDNLADDFTVLYGSKTAMPVQSFIFWYRMILSDFLNYKKNLLDHSVEALENNVSIKTGLKNLDSCYKKLDNLSLLNYLEDGVQIKE